MAKYRHALIILFIMALPATTAAQPSETDLDLQTAVTGLIIHSDVKTVFAEKAFEVAPRLTGKGQR